MNPLDPRERFSALRLLAREAPRTLRPDIDRLLVALDGVISWEDREFCLDPSDVLAAFDAVAIKAVEKHRAGVASEADALRAVRAAADAWTRVLIRARDSGA